MYFPSVGTETALHATYLELLRIERSIDLPNPTRCNAKSDIGQHHVRCKSIRNRGIHDKPIVRELCTRESNVEWLERLETVLFEDNEICQRIVVCERDVNARSKERERGKNSTSARQSRREV